MMMRTTVVVNDLMQKGFPYELVEPAGKNFNPEFNPELTGVVSMVLPLLYGQAPA